MNFKDYISTANSKTTRSITIIALVITLLGAFLQNCFGIIYHDPFTSIVPTILTLIIIELLFLIIFFPQINLLVLGIATFLARLTLIISWPLTMNFASTTNQYLYSISALFVGSLLTTFLEFPIIWFITKNWSNHKLTNKLILCIFLANVTSIGLLILQAIGGCTLVKWIFPLLQH